MKNYAMFLQLFADGAEGAPAGGGGETGTAAETGTGTEAPDLKVGDTMADGTQIQDARVAAALNRQMNRHPELRKVYGQGQQQAAQEAAPAAGNTPNDLQARWDAAKKGEFKDLYGQDVQRAIQDRFRNQADANEKLNAMQPMLNALMQKTGVETVEELQQLVLDDDSLYEDEAEERGMTVEQLKQFKAMESENQAYKQAEQRQEFQKHFSSLQQQADALKLMFPDFDLQTAMQDERFRNATAPGGWTVEEAYMALHGKELIPQLMAYGMQRAQNQMGQTIQAQGMRPAEGAMSPKSQAATVPNMNPANLSRPEREKFKQWVRLHGPVTFDGGGKTR